MAEVESYYCSNLFIYFFFQSSTEKPGTKTERGKIVNPITLKRTANNLEGFYMLLYARASLQKKASVADR